MAWQRSGIGQRRSSPQLLKSRRRCRGTGRFALRPLLASMSRDAISLLPAPRSPHFAEARWRETDSHRPSSAPRSAPLIGACAGMPASRPQSRARRGHGVAITGTTLPTHATECCNLERWLVLIHHTAFKTLRRVGPNLLPGTWASSDSSYDYAGSVVPQRLGSNA
jgi:hypothetical protein